MTVHRETRLVCEWGGCQDYVTEQLFRTFYERPSFGMSSTEIRRKAKRHGWRALIINGEKRDYCPRHATRAIEQRKRSPK